MPEKQGISIPLINWFDDPIKQSIGNVFNGINVSVEAIDIFKKYRRSQFKHIKGSVNSVKILGMSSPKKLIDIYYPTHVSTTIHRRLYEKEMRDIEESNEAKKSPFTFKRPIVRADAYISQHDRVLILGGPGCGKTTLLKYLAYAYSDKNTFSNTKLKHSKFPIFVRLPDFAITGKNLEEYIIDQLASRTDKYASAFLERVFKNKLGVLLLDSLDEVPNACKTDTVNSIKLFCEKYPGCSVIISCRTADYEYVMDEFYEVEVTKLSNAAMKKIVSAWFEDDKEQARILNRHLNNDNAIASLTETPLLLSLLCIQFQHDLTLPKRKAELYRRCVDAFLRDWDASRGFRRETSYENLTDDRKERVFEHVADYFFRKTPRYVFPEDKLTLEIGKYIERFDIDSKEAESTLKEIESHHGILEKHSVDSYGFSHPSFQEYFTARCALSRRTDVAVVKKYFEDNEWSGVIEFIVALREDPEELFKFMVKKCTIGEIKSSFPAIARRTNNLWLLYRCLSTGAALNSNFSDSLYEHVVDSQLKIADIYKNGGVVPFAVLMEDGVRHAYYYWKKRQTLYEALQPLRLLANTIFYMPSNHYAEKAFDAAMDIESKIEDKTFYHDTSLALCLVIPLASIIPKKVNKLLKLLRKRAEQKSEGKYYVKSIDESLLNLEKFY